MRDQFDPDSPIAGGVFPPVNAPARPVFVGRTHELAVLHTAVDDTFRGRGRTVLVVGDAGIGKTRLCDELARYAEERGGRVLWGGCWEGGGAPAYWPWVQALRSYIRDCDPQRLAAQLGNAATDVAHIVPELCARLPHVASPAPSKGDDTRFRTFDATTEFLARAAADKPIIIILDDLQVADESSILLLQFVSRSLRPMRILIVGAQRSIQSSDRLALLDELARDSDRVQLSGLDVSEIEVLIEAAGAAAALPLPPSRSRALAGAVYSVTEGNPFFIDALLRLLVSEHRLASGELPASGGFSVPHEIRAAVHRRLQSLSTDARGLLSMAAVLGRDLDYRLVEKLGSNLQVRDLLSEAEKAGIIVASRRDPADCGFSHVLIRDTLYEGLRPRLRSELHRSAARALEQVYGDDPDRFSQIAHHSLAAAAETIDPVARQADLQRATTFAERAGERAEAILAYEEAASCYERALSALDLGDSKPRRRCELLLALGEARRKAGDGARCRAAYVQAADIARRMLSADEAHAAELLARAALGLGTKGFWGTPPAGEVDVILLGVLEESLAAVGSGDSVLRAQLLACLALSLYWAPDQRSRGAALSAESVAIAKRLGDPQTQLLCWASHRMVTWTPDNALERLAAATEALRLAADVGHREINLFAYGMHISDAIEIGDFDTAKQDVAAYARIADELRQPQYTWWLTGLRMMLALVEGRLTEGEALAVDMLAKGQGTRADDSLRVFVMTQFSLRRDRGGLEELAGMPGVMNEQFRAFPIWRAGIALLLAEIGRPIEAQQELNLLAAADFAAVAHDMAWLCCVAMLAETAALLHDLPHAAALYDRMLGYRDRVVVLGFGFGSWGSLSRHLGVLATTLSRWQEATRHFEYALDVNQRMGARPCLARTHIDYARLLLMRGEEGDRSRAESLLRTALEITRECGMHRLAEHAETLLSQSAGSALTGSPTDAELTGASLGSVASSIFRLDGDYWTVAHREQVQRLRDSKGMRCIHHLLGHPDQEFHVVDLVAAIDQQRPEADSDDGYRRPAAPATERARVNITRVVGGAIRKIRANDAELGRYLATTIKTGTLCAYKADPDRPVRWEL